MSKPKGKYGGDDEDLIPRRDSEQALPYDKKPGAVLMNSPAKDGKRSPPRQKLQLAPAVDDGKVVKPGAMGMNVPANSGKKSSSGPKLALAPAVDDSYQRSATSPSALAAMPSGPPTLKRTVATAQSGGDFSAKYQSNSSVRIGGTASQPGAESFSGPTARNGKGVTSRTSQRSAGSSTIMGSSFEDDRTQVSTPGAVATRGVGTQRVKQGNKSNQSQENNDRIELAPGVDEDETDLSQSLISTSNTGRPDISSATGREGRSSMSRDIENRGEPEEDEVLDSVQVGAQAIEGIGGTPTDNDYYEEYNNVPEENVKKEDEDLEEGPDATPVAIAVNEDELEDEDYGYEVPPQIEGAAYAEPIPEEEDQKGILGWISRNRRVTMTIAILATLAVILGIVLGVVLRPEELSECDEFYRSQTLKFQQFADTLLDKNISTCETVLTNNTPQSEALLWLVEEGGEGPATEDEDLMIQRYALAVLYFATSGADWFDMLGFLSATSVCDWQNANTTTGVTACNENGFVTELQLVNNNLNGTIPSELGVLTQLRHVILDDNEFLTGLIPDTIGNIKALQEFNASSSTFTGQIPATIGGATNLTTFQVDGNSLSGSIPTEVGALTLLEIWNTGGNGMTGPLPSEMGLMSSLRLLLLKENELSGSIPSTFSALTGLSQVDFSANDFKDGAENICVPTIALDLYLADCYDQLVPAIAREVECGCCTACCNEEFSGCIPN